MADHHIAIQQATGQGGVCKDLALGAGQSIQNLVHIISQGELDGLRAVRGPQEFLDRFGGTSINEGYTPMISPFDAALTYYLVGNIPFCLDLLDDFASEDCIREGSTFTFQHAS